MRSENLIQSLTGVRFFAAIFVVISHGLPFVVPIENGPRPAVYAAFASLAGVGMSLFFVLSGFVIHYGYSEQIRSGGALGVRNFLIARWARLYPLYIVCLCFDLLLSYSYQQSIATVWEALPYYLTLTQSWFFVFLGGSSLIHQFGVMPTVAWSVSTEMFFYLMYPLIGLAILQLKTNAHRVAAGIFLAAVAFTLLFLLSEYIVPINDWAVARYGEKAGYGNQHAFLRWLVYFSPYSRIFEFVLGCLCASVYMSNRGTPPSINEERWGAVVLMGAIAALCLIYFSLFLPNFAPRVANSGIVNFLRMGFGLAVPVVVIIYCCARYHNFFTRWLMSPLLVRGGDASYSIYLLHLPVIYAFRWEAAPVTSLRVLVGDLLRFGLTCLCIIGLAVVVYAIIEQPSRRQIRRLISPLGSADRCGNR
jgi:peptidoglycan/LPS O-acetylase OafA/YrhL